MGRQEHKKNNVSGALGRQNGGKRNVFAVDAPDALDAFNWTLQKPWTPGTLQTPWTPWTPRAPAAAERLLARSRRAQAHLYALARGRPAQTRPSRSNLNALPVPR